MPIWIHLTAFPLRSDKPNIGYCAYVQSFSEMPDYELMTNIAPDIASNVLQICMKLRGANDFMSAISEVISDIRRMSTAERCCILTTDFGQRKCSVLCEAISDKSDLAPVKDYITDDFFYIVDTWHETIAGSTCAIIKDGQDWERLQKINPVWYNSIKANGVNNIILFPLRYRNDILGFIWASNFDISQTLKIKETDRIEAMKREARKLGYVVESRNDSELLWNGERCEPTNEPIDTYEDHRMALAFAPYAFKQQGLAINNPQVVSKSYPKFWENLKAAGFKLTVYSLSSCVPAVASGKAERTDDNLASPSDPSV